ncbi:hypothetical protein Tco_0122296 [Tanacetum coccineum]
MSNRHQELASPEQTATALASPEQTAPAMASPKQTAIGKDYSNPFMAAIVRSAEALLMKMEKFQITATIDEVQEKASTETEPFIQEVTPTEVIQDQGILRKGVFEVSTAGATKAEAIRLEEQMNEEQRAQIARDKEIARQWDEEERKRAMSEAKSTKKIDLE